MASVLVRLQAAPQTLALSHWEVDLTQGLAARLADTLARRAPPLEALILNHAKVLQQPRDPLRLKVGFSCDLGASLACL